MPLLTPADWGAVRASIDVSLTATELPDATIALPIYVDAAEAEVVALDPLALTYTAGTANNVSVRNAAIFLTAARLAYVVPVLKRETMTDGYSYERAIVEPAALEKRLRTLALAAVDAVLASSSSSSTIPTFFTRATGGRNR